MPQRPTTHKDLHRAAIGSVFSLAYMLSCGIVLADNPPPTNPVKAPAAAAPTRLVKNEVSKAPVASFASGSAQVKEVKLRAIPQSTLEGGATPLSAKSAKIESIQKPPAKEKKAEEKKAATPQAKAKPAKPAKPVQTVVRQPKLNNGLVPPPPPIMPIGMDSLGMFAQPVDYLSLKELEARKKELAARLNELTSIANDSDRQIRERKERAELFDSLYQEGVVSRKELEIAKREAGEIDRDLKFKQDELESVKSSMRAVNNRLYMLKKMDAKLNPKANSKSNSGKSKEKK